VSHPAVEQKSLDPNKNIRRSVPIHSTLQRNKQSSY
jgi:hypothetical protein